MKRLCLFLLVAAAALVAACAPQTYYLSLQEMRTSASGIELRGRTMAVVYLSDTDSLVQQYNAAKADQLTRRLERSYFQGQSDRVGIYCLERAPFGDYTAKDTLIRMVVETGDDVVFLLQNPSRTKAEDYEVAVLDALSGTDDVHCFAGVGNIGSEFDPEWKNVYFELYYFDSYSWIYALDDALDGDPLKAIEAWMDLAVKCRAAVKRSAACYNIALVCYLLEQNELAEKWLEQSDTIAPMDGSLALHQSLAKVKKK